MSLWQRMQSLWSPKEKRVETEQTLRDFRLQYSHFKDLLQSNAELGRIMADIDEKLQGTSLLGMGEIRALATRAIFHTLRMVTALNVISNNNYSILNEMVEHINGRINSILESKAQVATKTIIFPLSEIDKSHIDLVGGKCANLGELRNKVQVPSPQGFGITTYAYTLFLESDALQDEIQRQMREVKPNDPGGVMRVSKSICAIIDNTPVPSVLLDALDQAWGENFNNPDDTRAALRSSAIGEDGILSFSGQYRTILGVTRKSVGTAFRDVLASLFSPRAISYRIHHGLPFEQCAMGMACIEMVDAVASGIVFSRHPVNPFSEDMVINAIWGLGAYAVDGIIEPDTWQVSPGDPPHISSRFVAKKDIRLVADIHGKHEESVPEHLRQAPSLTDAQILSLTKMASRIEAHYRHPQDIEFAVNPSGEVLILQSRPMRLATIPYDIPDMTPVAGATMLVSQADIASAGVASGSAVWATKLDDLADFPAGGVLIAPHSFPNYALVMNRAAAIVTEAGSVTGHMASLSREFGVPTLLNAKQAMTLIAHGQMVTVDAMTGRVYDGVVEEVLEHQLTPRPVALADTPVHAALRLVADQIMPLHLLDPKSALFRPESCTSLHDVMRFVHETCYTEMFRISDRASLAGAVSHQLKAKLPIDLHIIDLGEGLVHVDGPYVYPEQIQSAPLNALLSGMLRPDVHIRGPRPVDLGGFFSVMSQHILEPPNVQAERFGDRSYCIVSDKYLNFSSRVGYHYSVIDAYCGLTMNKNYVTFQFKGGAADAVRRNRRARCIALILERLGFTTDVRGDMSQARFMKYSTAETASRLDQLGRLLMVTRQMDMLMTSDAAITLMADNFMAERYH